MSDVKTFLAFADNGRFTTLQSANVPGSSSDFDLSVGLNTFVTSKLMQSNNYFATPGDIVDEAAFTSKVDCATTSDSGCRTTDGKLFYWSPSTHRQYELRAKSGTPVIDLSTLMQHVGQDSWADAQLLFDGSYNCTAAGLAGGKIVNAGANGTVDVGCVSQLPMYLECGTPCPPSTQVGGICPFGYTKKC